VKTVISVDSGLLRQAQGVAKRMNVSLSHLFATAMEEFIERRRSQELLDAINAACRTGPEPNDEGRRSAVQRQHRRLVQGQW